MTSINEDVKRYLMVRKKTVEICQPLEIEDYVVQPVTEVSPPKWHLAHTTWFFERFILSQYIPQYQRFSPYFDELFNSYYKSCGKHWLQAERGILSRPTVSEVYTYRDSVDQNVVELLNSSHHQDKELKRLIEIGLQHEQQHQELLYMDIKSILSVNPCLPTYNPKPLPKNRKSPENWFKIEAGLYEVGAQNDSFCYDNEKPQHQYYQQACILKTQLVSNEEYKLFIEDKGYENPLLWLSDGWNWVMSSGSSHPRYWNIRDNEWYEFTLHGEQLLDKEAPVCHINYYEADAFARWSGARLPREQELEIYLTQTHHSPGHNQDFFHPVSLDIHHKQLWIWTQSAYSAYPGYQAYEGSLGEYNGKFMCNQQVLRGGCCVTPKNHYRPTYRNFYLTHQNWMFSGVCLAKDCL